MIVNLEKYTGKYRIVSLACEASVKEDLLADELDFIYLSDSSPLLNFFAASIIYLSRKPERITARSSFVSEAVVSISGNE